MGKIIKIILILIGVLVTTITIIKAIMEAKKFTKADNTFERGKIYFGMYTFFKRVLPERIEFIPLVVDSEKKLNIVCPDNKYTGKF